MALQYAAKILGLLKYYHPSFLSRNCQFRYESLFTNFPKLKAVQRAADENKLVEKITTTEHEEVKIEDVKTDEESVDTVPKIHRRFPKSSTQNAVTSCLKPSRLSSPFPEPVKMILSHETVSDEEKSRRMEEEVKLEARFTLQQQQEKLLQENLRRKSNPSENSSGLEDLLNKNKQSCNEMETKSEYNNELEDMYYNNSKRTYSAKSENNNNNNKRSSSRNKRSQNQTVPQEAEPAKTETKKGRRGRSKIRSPRLLRSSKNTATDQVRGYRNYSTFSKCSPLTEPAIISDAQQIDTLLNQLKLLDPKYKQIKKPLFFPGSEEEKKFYRMILKLISEQKHESKRLSAPYPSYSEVKTYACEVKTKVYGSQLNKNNMEPLWGLGKPNARSYSTAARNTFRSKFDTRPNYEHRKTLLQTLRHELFAKIERYKDSIKNFSTSTFMWKDEVKKDKVELREKPPCECPYPNVPICDYEEVARANKERRKSRGRKPCVDGCPVPCDPCPCGPCNPCNPGPCNPCNPHNPCNTCRKCSTMPIISTVEGLNDDTNVVNRIKVWLNTWKPESENIKISKCSTNDEDRETYVIEISECPDGNIKDEQLKGELLHIPNMEEEAIYEEFQIEIPREFSETDKIIIKNIPDYMSLDPFASVSMLDTIDTLTIPPEMPIYTADVLEENTNLPNETKLRTESTDFSNLLLEETNPIPKKMPNDMILQESKPIQKKMVADINNILDANKSIKKKMAMLDINSNLEGNKSKQQIKTINLNGIMRQAENFYIDDSKRNNENLNMVEKKKDVKLSDKIIEQVKLFKPIDSYVEYDSNVLMRQDNKFMNKPKIEHFKLKSEFWRK